MTKSFTFKMEAKDYLAKAKGYLEDAIDLARDEYKRTKDRKERSEIRNTYEQLVKMDTTRCGFRRYINLK